MLGKFFSFFPLLVAASCVCSQEKPEVTLGVIADCQYANAENSGQRLYQSCPEKLSKAIDNFNQEDLHFIVHLGDFIDKDWNNFSPLLKLVEHSKHPFKFVLGNHDFSVDDSHKSKVAEILELPSRYYSFSKKNWVFLVLDGNDLSTYGWPSGSPQEKLSKSVKAKRFPNAPTWNGGIGSKQLNWIEETLKKADKSGKNAIIFSHFPVFPQDKHNLWNAQEVLQLLDKHSSVVAWFNGHNHEGNYGVRKGIHYVNFKGMLDTPETAFSIAKLYSDKIEITGFGRESSRVLPIKK